jgi:hypothetical protein
VQRHTLIAALTVSAAAAAFPLLADASAPPIGALPTPAVTLVQTHSGSLVSVALPRRADREWRIARNSDQRVMRQVSEADVAGSVVLVFKAVGKGSTSVTLAETRGERAKVYRAVRYTVRVG